MSRETNPMREREDIELLLPWYVTGRLSAEDRARVEACLQRDPDLARQLPLAAEESLEARRSAEATPVPAGLSVERTLAKALAQERRQQKPAVTSRTVSQPGVLERLKEALRDFLVLPEGNIRFAAVAALAVIAVQGAAIATFVASRDSTYQVAGGAAVPSAGTFALVRFTDAATAKAITDLLAARDMAIADGPKAGGFYRVRVGTSELAAAERDRRLAGLRSETALVSLVLPAN
jgi:anti-sigma factor RsiW